MADLTHSLKQVTTIINAVKTADANGTDVNVTGYESATLVVQVGAEGDTLAANLFFKLHIEHADDNGSGSAGTYAECTQAEVTGGTIAANGVWLILDGTGTAGSGGNPDSVGLVDRIGYIGNKKFVRAKISKSGTHSNGTPISAQFILANARHTTDNAKADHNV